MSGLSIHPTDAATALAVGLDAVIAANPGSITISISAVVTAVLNDHPDWEPAKPQLSRQAADALWARFTDSWHTSNKLNITQ